MTQIDPAELSALLDGELDKARAREVEAALAADPQMRAEYEALAVKDKRWRSAARGAAFAPRTRFGQAFNFSLAAGLALALIALRLAQKAIDALGPALLLHGAALVLAMAALIWMARGGGAAPEKTPAGSRRSI